MRPSGPDRKNRVLGGGSSAARAGGSSVRLPPVGPGLGGAGVGVAPRRQAVEQASEVEQVPVAALRPGGADGVDDGGVVGVDGGIDGPGVVLREVRDRGGGRTRRR